MGQSKRDEVDAAMWLLVMVLRGKFVWARTGVRPCRCQNRVVGTSGEMVLDLPKDVASKHFLPFFLPSLRKHQNIDRVLGGEEDDLEIKGQTREPELMRLELLVALTIF